MLAAYIVKHQDHPEVFLQTVSGPAIRLSTSEYDQLTGVYQVPVITHFDDRRHEYLLSQDRVVTLQVG